MNFFGGVNFSTRGLWGFVGSPGEYLKFRFLSPFEHHRYLKSGVLTPPPPPPPPRLGAVLFVRSLMFGAVIFIFPQFRHFSGSSHCWNVDKLCDAASLTIVLIISPGMTPSSVCNPFYWLPGPKIKRVTLTSFRSNIAVTRNKYKVP